MLQRALALSLLLAVAYCDEADETSDQMEMAKVPVTGQVFCRNETRPNLLIQLMRNTTNSETLEHEILVEATTDDSGIFSIAAVSFELDDAFLRIVHSCDAEQHMVCKDYTDVMLIPNPEEEQLALGEIHLEAMTNVRIQCSEPMVEAASMLTFASVLSVSFFAFVL